jgi:hypothetical protein
MVRDLAERDQAAPRHVADHGLQLGGADAGAADRQARSLAFGAGAPIFAVLAGIGVVGLVFSACGCLRR